MFIQIIPTEEQLDELQPFFDKVESLNEDDRYIIVGQFRIAETALEEHSFMFDIFLNQYGERVEQVFKEEREKQKTVNVEENQ